ncbi:hypothetical protein HKW90_01690 [Pseudomonas aeruginosa]|uniref:hypothetical protein n=1 Tax=Pseudomonas nitroreducens TaxID=46680 RepID=UPI00351D3287|nr:hypothetical protein [Pseudomonas aeruginosa]
MTNVFQKSRSLAKRTFRDHSEALLKSVRQLHKRAEQAARGAISENGAAALQEAERALIEAQRASSSMAKTGQGRKHLHEGLKAGASAEDSILMAEALLEEIEQQTNSVPQN